MSAATAQKEKSQQRAPPQQDDDESEYYSEDDYSEGDYSEEGDDDYSVEEYETPKKNENPRRRSLQPQPQRQPQRQQQRQPQRQQTKENQPRRMETAVSDDEKDDRGMQPFEHIGPPSTSMNGPVTYARAQRGEIPMREGNPNQKLQTAEGQSKSLDDEEGLKLKLELNLDIEVELKASIHGDLTLALLA